MRAWKPSSRTAKFAALLFTWGSFALLLAGGLMLLEFYEESVTPYIGSFCIVVIGTGTMFAFLTWGILRDKKISTADRVPLVFWTCIVLAGGMAGTIIAGPKLNEYISTSPYLTWIDGQDPSSAITVNWITTYPTTDSVSYGTNRWSLTQVAPAGVNTRFHHAVLTGLASNTTYYYQVPGFPVKQFKTAPTGAFNFTFYAWTDHRTNSDYVLSCFQPNVVEGIASYAATKGVPGAFSICCGDITSTSNDYQGWDVFFNDIAYQDWTANKSLQLIYGNHERNGDPGKVIVKNMFPYPQKADTNFFYSFDYGMAHFIMLDPYDIGHSWSSEFSAEQLAWLESDLAASTDANFTLIFMHPPPWSLGGVRTALARLVNIEGYDIDVIFCGHDHVFDRRILATTSIPVLTLGLGGNPTSEYSDFDCDTAFARFDISTTGIEVTSIFINGTILDTFTIPA
ncbi:MAG: fibronectin type III domain-containing protein [Candidatus Sigynarchaeum springense]